MAVMVIALMAFALPAAASIVVVADGIVYRLHECGRARGVPPYQEPARVRQRPPEIMCERADAGKCVAHRLQLHWRVAHNLVVP